MSAVLSDICQRLSAKYPAKAAPVDPVQDVQARTLRDEGMQRAVDHADRVIPDWKLDALAYVKQYAEANEQFMGELARRYAEARGFPPPPDKRAWGAVMMAAAKAGYVKKLGWTTATDPKVHKNPVSLWGSQIYRGGA